MDMHRSGQTGEYDGQYIWLRHSIQFTIGGLPHTISMEIPVPVGASAELREQLIREAEAGIEQMYRQIEKRGAGRSQPPPEASRQQVPGQTATRPATSAAPTRQPGESAPPQQVATQASPRDTSQIISLQGKREAAEATAPAPTRSSIGSEMPSTHNLDDHTSGAIKLREFIQIIRERWNISPKDAMDLLQVRNLNDMNYRDLLKQLEPLVEQHAKATSKNTTNQTRPTTAPAPVASSPRAPTPIQAATSPTTMRNASTSARPASPSPPSTPAPPGNATNRAPAPPNLAPSPSKPATPAVSPGLDGPANIPVFPLPANTLREVPRSYKFDEEDEETGEAQSGNDADESGMSNALARIKIDELREIRGTATASPGRLTVLHNLLDSQISDTQFQQLIEGLWNINSDKKLKQDHVEALISWAKEDYFEDEVRAVLAVING
jgi:hypothetical protein